jgi:hypothetical protein
MKIVELLNHVSLPISNEESDLLGKFANSPVIAKESMDDRQIHIANQLVNKDVLLRKNQNGKIIFKKKITV